MGGTIKIEQQGPSNAVITFTIRAKKVHSKFSQQFAAYDAQKEKLDTDLSKKFH